MHQNEIIGSTDEEDLRALAHRFATPGEVSPPCFPGRRGGDKIAGVGRTYCHFLKRIRGLYCPYHAPPWSRTMTSTRTLAFAGRNYQSRGKRFTLDPRFRGERTLLSYCHDSLTDYALFNDESFYFETFSTDKRFLRWHSWYREELFFSSFQF